MICDRLNFSLQLAMVDRGGEHPLATIPNPFRQRRRPPAKFGPHGDLPQPLRLAGQ